MSSTTRADRMTGWADAPQALTLGDVSREHRRRFPSRTAAVCGDDRLTYAELDDRASQVANVLRSMGCGPGSAVAWVGQNCHRVLELLVGCAKVGAMVCPVNWRSSPTELAFALEDLQPELVVWQEAEVGDRLREARAGLDELRGASGAPTRWVRHDTDDKDGYEALMSGADPSDPEEGIDPLSPVLVIYTGAFGGKPHPAGLHHLSLTMRAMYEAIAAHIDHDFAYLNNGPMFHVGNWRTTMPTFLFGGKNVFIRRVEPKLMCELIERERCNGAYLVPVTREQLAEANNDAAFDLSSLRDSGGDAAWQAMISPTPASTGYGQTETGGVITTTSFGPPGLGAAGRSLPMSQVRIVDPDGRELAIGEVGEIVARGLTVMSGYVRRAQDSTRDFRGGWWHTGDLGRREADGTVTFVGPSQRMIKSASENIYPAEVEQCLRMHPKVAECVVIGVPDPHWTQSVKAIVVLRPGERADADEVIEHCRRVIASYKKPRFVEFVDELPHKGGVLDIDLIEERFGGGGYPGQDGHQTGRTVAW